MRKYARQNAVLLHLHPKNCHFQVSDAPFPASSPAHRLPHRDMPDDGKANNCADTIPYQTSCLIGKSPYHCLPAPPLEDAPFSPSSPLYQSVSPSCPSACCHESPQTDRRYSAEPTRYPDRQNLPEYYSYLKTDLYLPPIFHSHIFRQPSPKAG